MRATGLLLAGIVVLAGCSSGIYNRRGGDPRLYTLTNLYYDEIHDNFSPMNFSEGELLPVCTAVSIDRVGSLSMLFTELENDRQNRYDLMAVPEPSREHLRRLFGRECPRERLRGLSQIDREGIRDGRAYPGMTRRGVIIALGYPPLEFNRSIRSRVLLYFHNRINRFEVEFEDDIVVDVRE